ncbi:MAG: SH3 domain-containing protein [Simkaniaceae bacterium]|nr:SH3 domain-containing protein [Simkaniaceae bacterium]
MRACLITLFASSALLGTVTATETSAASHRVSSFKPFTGKVLGNNVRMRANADIESPIVRELGKNDLVVVVDELNDFYGVEPIGEVKAFIFRSFVLDGKVEGNRVNVRLAPSLESPVIGHLNTGDIVDGDVSPENNKWLEIVPPASTKFYVAKEFVDYVAGPEYKAIQDKKLSDVKHLIKSAKLLVESEMQKPFEEIDYQRIAKAYHTISDDYTEFPKFVEEAKNSLTAVHETYLQKKLAYLESKAGSMERAVAKKPAMMVTPKEVKEAVTQSPTDRMKIWEPVEESLYLIWAKRHNAKSMNDYYNEQQVKSEVLTGILESYKEPVKMKPGDYILRENGLPVAYLYSTHVDLSKLVDKEVNLIVSQRPNNSFAFPSYYVLGVE